MELTLNFTIFKANINILGSEIKIQRKIIKALNEFRNKKSILCKAPFTSISIGFDGKVSPCCYTQIADPDLGIDYISQHSLITIWNGQTFKGYRKLIQNNKLPYSCSICAEKLNQKEFNSLKIEEYKNYESQSDYPSIIEIAVDSICNLECIMCSSRFSTSITKSEGLISKPKINFDNLFDNLKEFIPHLNDIIFSGGEPMLSNFYYKVWQYIIGINPKCNITLNTNASIIPNKIKDLIEKGRFHFNISLDTIDKKSYEIIRKNAKLEDTLENFAYLKEYCERKNTSLSVAVCPLKLNYKNISDLVEFCNMHNADLFFVHVFQAYDVALHSAPINTIKNAISYFNQILPDNSTNTSKRNYLQVLDLISNCKNWLLESKYREDFIKSIVINEDEFKKCKKDLLLRISTYLENENLLKDNKKNVLTKLEQVLNEVPVYTKTKAFYNELQAYSSSTIVNKLINSSIREVLWLFETIFRDKLLLKNK